jgi:uncharacterized protein (DUF885 family)
MHTRLPVPTFVLVIFCLLSLAAHADPAKQTARLHQWLDARYEEELQMSPIALTKLGRKELYDEVDDYSRGAIEDYLSWIALSGEKLAREFDYEALTPDGKVSYDFWMFRVNSNSAYAPFIDHDYVMTPWTEAHTEPVQFMVNMHAVSSDADMVAYVDRIEAWGRALGQLMDRVEFSAAKGIRPPRFSYEIVIEQSGNLISGIPFSEEGDASSLWADAGRKISSLEDAGSISSARAGELLRDVKKALVEKLQPAYQRIILWHQQDIENADGDPRGVYALPNGKAYFDYRLATNTQSSMSPTEVHELGLREVSRIQAEIQTLMIDVGFRGSLQEFFDYVREDPRFYYSNDDAGRREYLEQTRNHLAFIEEKLPLYFGRLPQAALEVRRVEAYRERDGDAAFYVESTPDGSRPGVYYVHMSDMNANNVIDLETTAYHEGSPGHHMQSAIALENEALPLFRRSTWYSAYGEGWALYAEYLAKEMGAFKDPYADLGRLVNELWRAMRLVVDTGLHAMDWTEQQAVAYFLANTPSPETMARSEVQRYLLSPGQASSYKSGMLRIQAMRARAERALGDDFDVRSFHDLVLGGGSVPLPVLEQRLDSWLVEQRVK